MRFDVSSSISFVLAPLFDRLSLGREGDETRVKLDGEEGSEVRRDGEDEEDKPQHNECYRGTRLMFLPIQVVDCAQDIRQRAPKGP